MFRSIQNTLQVYVQCQGRQFVIVIHGLGFASDAHTTATVEWRDRGMTVY
jgi:hypothetical protein